MSNIISLASYKKKKGIAPLRSPYYTLNATRAQVVEAVRRASDMLDEPLASTGKLPQAVLIGYTDKSERTKLLKNFSVYPNEELLEANAGRKSMRSVYVTKK